MVWYENFHKHEKRKKKKDHIAPKCFVACFFFKQVRGSGRAKLTAKFIFCCARVTKQSRPRNVRQGVHPGVSAGDQVRHHGDGHRALALPAPRTLLLKPISSQFNASFASSSAPFLTAALRTQLVNIMYTPRKCFPAVGTIGAILSVPLPGAPGRSAVAGSSQNPSPEKVQTLKYLELLFEGIYFKAALTAAGNYQGGTLRFPSC